MKMGHMDGLERFAHFGTCLHFQWLSCWVWDVKDKIMLICGERSLPAFQKSKIAFIPAAVTVLLYKKTDGIS